MAETLDFPPGQGFDLVVACNVLVYCNRLEQALAMANIARLRNPGGIFPADNPLPAEHASDVTRDAGSAIAAANQLTVVCTKKAGLPDHLGDCAVWVDEGNPEQLAYRIMELLECGEQRWELGLRFVERAKNACPGT